MSNIGTSQIGTIYFSKCPNVPSGSQLHGWFFHHFSSLIFANELNLQWLGHGGIYQLAMIFFTMSYLRKKLMLMWG